MHPLGQQHFDKSSTQARARPGDKRVPMKLVERKSHRDGMSSAEGLHARPMMQESIREIGT
jgi:hypothetical protein